MISISMDLNHFLDKLCIKWMLDLYILTCWTRINLSFFENTVDPDQLASDQDPHCFPVWLKI